MNWFAGLKRALIAGQAVLDGNRRRKCTLAFRQRLVFEPLEPRLTLAAAGLVSVGTQPTGTLSGKIVYTSGGHGWDFEGGSWSPDRGTLLGMNEAYGNQDQIVYYADYLLQAGATVVPMRPVGRQVNEVVLDNDSNGVTYTGTWSNNTAGPRWYDEDYGAGGDDATKYRFAVVSASETAAATYTPNMPAAGFYPVYTWVSPSSNRASQLYKINHTGGQTQIRADHRLVGNGWVYLGTYHFKSGSSITEGSVVISNQSTSGSNVVADAIRFGNGMGDLPRGSGGFGTGSLSGQPREDEASIFWVYRGFGQHTVAQSSATTVIGSSNISAPSNMARHMNVDSNPFGTSVYIGFHSNATANGTARGARGLMTTSTSLRTPNQANLALFLGRQINQDFVALAASTEFNNLFGADWTWYQGSSHVGDNANFSEIDLGPSAEFDATIIEVAFHDNVDDAPILRDPKGRDQIARSVYQGTLEYFVTYGGVQNVSLPTTPSQVRAASNAEGQVTVSWAAGPNTPAGVYGNSATRFRVFASSDGYGFDGGTLVSGGAATSVTISGYDPTKPYYYRVVAENDGGQSKPSEVVTALPSGGAKQVLIVNGFDRFDESQNLQYAALAPRSLDVDDRVWQRYGNSFDYVVQVHTAIHAAAPGVHVASTSNEAVISGAVNLTDYDTVIWISGEESTEDESFNSTEQQKVEQFIAAGGNLFVSGSEIGWDLDRTTGPTAADRAFYETTLKANYAGDDAGSYTTTPVVGGIFSGMPNVVFSNGATFSSLDGQYYNAEFPDVIAAQAGAQLALNYVGGTGGGAAIQVAGAAGRGNIVLFGFPFETITDAARRADIIDRVFDFFGLATIVPDNADFNNDNFVDTADYVIWRQNVNTSVPAGTLGDANHDSLVNEADYLIWRSQYGTSPGSGAAVTSSQPIAYSAVSGAPAAESSAVTVASTVVPSDTLAVSDQMTPSSHQRNPSTRGAFVTTHRFPNVRANQALLNLLAVRRAESENNDMQFAPAKHDSREATERNDVDGGLCARNALWKNPL